MSVIIKPLGDDVRDFLDKLIAGNYLDGHCYELAIALHRALGWPLIGLIQSLYGQSVIRHAAVRHPDSGFFDGRGWISDDQFTDPFGHGSIVTFHLESELKHRTRPILENHITMAGKLAMSRWPELPWLGDTHFRKIVSFLDDLEILCRRHGFWLHDWPSIAPDGGDEMGYALVTTGNGSYTANRLLKVDRDMEKYADRLRRLQLPDQVIEQITGELREPELITGE
jgi:hypothetical protein